VLFSNPNLKNRGGEIVNKRCSRVDGAWAQKKKQATGKKEKNFESQNGKIKIGRFRFTKEGSKLPRLSSTKRTWFSQNRGGERKNKMLTVYGNIAGSRKQKSEKSKKSQP